MSESKLEGSVKDIETLQFMKDKVFLIIGAENQLGLYLAQISAELGSQTILAGMNEPLLKEAAKRLVSENYKAFFTCLNPTKPEEVENTFISLRQKFEKINYLVLNMDFRNSKKIQDTSWIDWQNHLLINLSAPFLFIKYAFTYMQENSKIILINSNKQNSDNSMDAAYCTSKAGLQKFVQIARKETAEHDLDIIEVFFDESTFKDADDEKIKRFFYASAKQIILALNPMNESSQPELHLGCKSQNYD